MRRAVRPRSVKDAEVSSGNGTQTSERGFPSTVGFLFFFLGRLCVDLFAPQLIDVGDFLNV